MGILDESKSQTASELTEMQTQRTFGHGKFAESFSWKVQLLRTKMILTWMHFIPREPMNHNMFSIGNNGCKIVSAIEAQGEREARIRTQAAGRTPCDARQPIMKVLITIKL